MTTDGSTPLDQDELEDLIPSQIATRAALDELEQRNILVAATWLFARRRAVEQLLSEKFLMELHRRMFSEVWRWAGSYRRSGKNIGVDWTTISVRVRELLANTTAQLASDGANAEEIAARFHHALVQIHLFANGNGRHGRLITDALLVALGQKPFTWGATAKCPLSEVREAYLEALRAADRENFAALRAFVRS